MFSTTD
jgi:hypothetical protein